MKQLDKWQKMIVMNNVYNLQHGRYYSSIYAAYKNPSDRKIWSYNRITNELFENEKIKIERIGITYVGVQTYTITCLYYDNNEGKHARVYTAHNIYDTILN